MHYEVALLNSVLEGQDIIPVVEQGAEAIFEEYKDVWKWVFNFYSKYDKVPSKGIVKDEFKTFDLLDTSSAPLQFYIDAAKKESMSKNTRAAMQQAIELLKDAGPNAALNYLVSQGHSILREVGGLKDANVVDYHERADVFRERYENPDQHLSGIPSGIRVIDKIHGGWQKADFVCLLGIPGCGKTWLSRLFAINAWKAGYSPLIISLEMSRQQEEARFDTILNEGEYFTGSDLANAQNLSPEDYNVWLKSTYDGKPPMHLVTAEGLDTANQNMVQAKIDQYNPDVVIVDYVNIMEDADRGGTETDRIRNIFRSLKRMAVKNNVPIISIAAATMKPEDYGKRAPEMGELAWSKHAAHDLDLLLAIHREPESNIFEVITRKTRRCEPFAFYLDWNLNSGKWKEGYGDDDDGDV